MKYGVNPTSPHIVSLNMSWPLHSLMNLFMINNFLIHFMLMLPSLIQMLPPSMKKQILKSNNFLCLFKILMMKKKWNMDFLFILMIIHSPIHFSLCRNNRSMLCAMMLRRSTYWRAIFFCVSWRYWCWKRS